MKRRRLPIVAIIGLATSTVFVVIVGGSI